MRITIHDQTYFADIKNYFDKKTAFTVDTISQQTLDDIKRLDDSLGTFFWYFNGTNE